MKHVDLTNKNKNNMHIYIYNVIKCCTNDQLVRCLKQYCTDIVGSWYIVLSFFLIERTDKIENRNRNKNVKIVNVRVHISICV